MTPKFSTNLLCDAIKLNRHRQEDLCLRLLERHRFKEMIKKEGIKWKKKG